MKKVLFLVLIVLLLCVTVTAFAESEIMFNSISWLSDEDATFQKLSDAGYLKKGEIPAFSHDNSVYFVTNEVLEYQPTRDNKYNNVVLSSEIQGRGKIAGYPVEKLILTFAYDGYYRLISVKVNLLGADFDSLNNKLTKVYGESSNKTIEEEGIIAHIWKGDNNSAVMLYTESDGFDYELIFGRTDADVILSNCLTPVDPDDVSGL